MFYATVLLCVESGSDNTVKALIGAGDIGSVVGLGVGIGDEFSEAASVLEAFCVVSVDFREVRTGRGL